MMQYLHFSGYLHVIVSRCNSCLVSFFTVQVVCYENENKTRELVKSD